MTIESIEAAKNCGVFDFSKADGHTSPFAKYNLIYGWNGSGKSTLSRLFYAIESGKVPPPRLAERVSHSRLLGVLSTQAVSVMVRRMCGSSTKTLSSAT